MTRRIAISLTAITASIAVPAIMLADATPPQTAPYRHEPLSIESGVHQGALNDMTLAFQDIIVVQGAPWLRLHVSDHHLGRFSFVLIRSPQTGAEQRMSATAFENWRNYTAFFGGDLLEVELYVAPGEQNIFVNIDDVWVGTGADQGTDPGAGNPIGAPRDLCGSDSRVPSNDPRVGRIFGGGCTAWMAANGAFLTAGHCVDGDPDQGGPGLPDGVIDNGFLNTVVEFNVLPSLANGMPRPALPQDQYPVTGAYVAYQFAGSNSSMNSIGADWAVFHVGPNANGVTPQQSQNAFFRVSGAASSTVGQTLQVTGYGFDWTPAGTGGPGAPCCDIDSDFVCDFICNSQNVTEQTATGVCTEFEDNGSKAWLRYEVDTTPATSGSPVIRVANGEALGINTNSGCANDGNWGTTFDQETLHDFLNDYIWGSGVAYADAASVCVLGTCAGTVYNPHPTIPEAVSDVANGSTIVIIPGNYTAANGNVFTAGADHKAMTLIAPFGGVVIGN